MNAAHPYPLGVGLFPLREAARLAQLDVRTARRWSQGYAYTYHGEKKVSPGVMDLVLPVKGPERDLTFQEMLTLRLVGAFRGAGLSLPVIKRVSKVAAQKYDLSLPFVSRRFRTDGRKIFLELQSEPAANDDEAIPPRERQVIEVLTGQQNFAAVVEPSLFGNVGWDHDLASCWWPLTRARTVVLDPKVLFGAPHIKDTSMPTSAIASAVHAEEGAVDAVAEWFGISLDAVKDAVHFETVWLNRVA